MTVMTTVCLRVIVSINIALLVAQALPATESEFRAFRVGLSSEGYSSAVSLTTDKHGNIFIVGNTNGSFGKADGENVSADSIFMAKFSRSGILIWLTRTGSAYLDKATSIYHFGVNVYVSGYTLGNISLGKQPEGTKSSHGVEDGFVLCYNSFRGNRVWSKQFGRKDARTKIERVAASRSSGIIVAGRTNGSLFLNDDRAVNAQEFFLVQLNHATGHIEASTQMENRAAWPFSWPQKLLVVEENYSLYVVLHTDENDERNMGVVVCMPLEQFGSFERVITVGEEAMDKNVYYGLAHERRTGKLALSFTKGSMGPSQKLNSMRPAFALRVISNNTRPRQWTDRMFSFDQGIDSAKDIVINEAGFALVMGVTTVAGLKRGHTQGKNSIPALWVYDVREMKTVGSHVSSNMNGLHCDRITQFDLDSDGNVVYAGVRTTADGTGEVLLGSFGTPPEYKWRAGDEMSKPVKFYILDDGSVTTNEMLAVQDSQTSKQRLDEEKRESIDMGAIASICIGSALVALACAVLYAVIVKRRKRSAIQHGPIGLPDLRTSDHRVVTKPGQGPALEHLFNEDS